MKRLSGALLALTIITLFICGGGAVYASRLKPIEPPVTAQPLNATIVFNLVNKERVKAGLKPLVRDARLDASAQFKADDMVARNYFDHYDPTNEKVMNGVQKGYELTDHNTCKTISENLVDDINETGDGNISSVSSWMQSKPHHDAILNPDYTLTGVAISGTKVVQHFCVSK